VSTGCFQTTFDPAVVGPASRFISESREKQLAQTVEALAVLRFSVILTARWESSETEDAEQRAELRKELVVLRKQYGDKLDEIAMNFGVAHAMTVKEEVERNVILPREVKVSGLPVHCNSEVADSDFEV
jgi:hypothetical protein